MNNNSGWQAWTAAATALADCLARENDALARIDYVAANAMAQDKQRAIEGLASAQAAVRSAPAPAGLSRNTAQRLEALAHDNRQLLTRAIVVQSRVIDCFARAVRGATTAAPRYGASGALANARAVAPVTFVLRA